MLNLLSNTEVILAKHPKFDVVVAILLFIFNSFIDSYDLLVQLYIVKRAILYRS